VGVRGTSLGSWGLDRIPALRLAEPAHAERVNLRVEECVGVEQNVGNIHNCPSRMNAMLLQKSSSTDMRTLTDTSNQFVTCVDLKSTDHV
jgi:hypothetical protein